MQKFLRNVKKNIKVVNTDGLGPLYHITANNSLIVDVSASLFPIQIPLYIFIGRFPPSAQWDVTGVLDLKDVAH